MHAGGRSSDAIEKGAGTERFGTINSLQEWSIDMKRLKQALHLSFAWLCLGGLALCGAARAEVACNIELREIYSNADRSVQFLILNQGSYIPPDGNDDCFKGRTLVAGNGETQSTFTFPGKSPLISYQPVLVATQGFADLHLVEPDYIVPNGFLPARSGSVAFLPGTWYAGTPRETPVVRYGVLPTDGVRALYRMHQDIGGPPDGHTVTYGDVIEYAETAQATNNAGETYLFPLATKFSGLWWNPSEPGWGLAVEHQGDTVFAAWAGYDADGSPTWFFVPSAKLKISGAADFDWGMFYGYFGAPNTYVGTVYRTKGPAFNSGGFNPSAVTATPVGYGEISFSTNVDDKASSGIAGSRFSFGGSTFGIGNAIARQAFGSPVSVCAAGAAAGETPNYQGLWWNAAESGWGLHLTQQGDAIAALWLTYETGGNATWFVMFANRTAPNAYTGTIYRTTGPAYTAPEFDSSKVRTASVGSGTLTFADRNNGAFSYVIGGAAQTRPIARQIFSDVPTVCNQ
jgi:hypothetical protein